MTIAIIIIALGALCYIAIGMGAIDSFEEQVDRYYKRPITTWERLGAGFLWPVRGLISFGQWVGRG